MSALGAPAAPASPPTPRRGRDAFSPKPIWRRVEHAHTHSDSAIPLHTRRRASASPSATTSARASPRLGGPPLRPPSPVERDVDIPDPDRLVKLAPAVVKGRQGAVLARGFLLKQDHLARNRALDLPHHLQGAPNFRGTALGIFGVAQPTRVGLVTVLSVLKAHPTGRGRAVWFCTREEPLVYIGGRPFVLRDAARPTQTFAISERAENIEGIEQRLKVDVLKEANRYGGLLLVHEEIAEGEIIPTWIAASAADVLTTRELWESIRNEGYHVDYHRIPISSDQAPEDGYLDRYVAILRDIPTSSSLIFNCGMGFIRTTFAMSAALIMRRRQVLKENGEDVFSLESKDASGVNVMEQIALRAVSEKQRDTRCLLKLMQLLQRCVSFLQFRQFLLNLNLRAVSLLGLPVVNQTAIVELLTTMPGLLANLQKAMIGDYDIILSLGSILDEGRLDKEIVDRVVESCDDVINLRNDILEHRVQLAVTAMNESQKTDCLRRALAALERYFFLITFSSYCNEPPMSFRDTFSPWLRGRAEIMNMLTRLRTTARQFVFAPVHDLAPLSSGSAGTVVPTPDLHSKLLQLKSAGGEIVGHEWADHIIHSRSGITLRAGLILKSDSWPSQFSKSDHQVRGATNFRRVPSTSLFGLSQPTEEGIDRVLERVFKEVQHENKATWINLREEPLIFVNGLPYVLRLDAISLRNIKSYAGIAPSRLELLEDRLKSDVIAELGSFEGRLLLHTETDDGSVIPVWETAQPQDIKTLRQIMDECTAKSSSKFVVDFYRQPLTAEKSPDFEDIHALISIVAQAGSEAPFIVNCQLGRGRSTLTMVCILLIQRWLRHGGRRFAFKDIEPMKHARSYQVINNLVRVMRHGGSIRAGVNLAIEQCSAVYDLIESIEICRKAADDAADLSIRDIQTKRGLHNLRRYAFLCVFAAYLNETRAETWSELQGTKSFENFWQQHQVFKTILNELQVANIHALTPLEASVLSGHVSTWTEEEQNIVANRKGTVLSAQTMLKSDFFLGLQKMTLPLKITGLPNIRQQSLLFDHEVSFSEQCIFGCGMPTVDGLRRGLEKMRANDGRKIFWTSMREEPVLYVRGRPHVLRLFDQPLENVVTTGVSTAAVEGMEEVLRNDVLREMTEHEGRILLHDEIEEDGSFHVNAIWEDVKPEDIMTPRQVFEQMEREGFTVDYARLPVTDEQAPIPLVFSRLEQRVVAALKHDDTHLVFNCQMGRGRTTTGMVAAMLVANILVRREHVDMAGSVISDAPGMMSSFDATDSWDSSERDPYLQGEYKAILQLVGVLSHGRMAKRLADKAIDAMEAVQNLRKAVADFKIRAESAEPGSEKQKKTTMAAINYLYRYGTLIAFTNWLLERVEVDELGGDEPSPFPQWLQEHREISHVLQRKSLD